jgi:hypothetical protein
MRILSLLIAAEAPKADMLVEVPTGSRWRAAAMGRQQLTTQKCNPPLQALCVVSEYSAYGNLSPRPSLLRADRRALRQCGRANIMQAVNGTVQSRKCLLAIMLTYSFGSATCTVNTFAMSSRCIRLRQRAALHLLAAFISKLNFV